MGSKLHHIEGLATWRLWALWACCVWVGVSGLGAQSGGWTSLRNAWVAPVGDSLVLDSFTVAPGSLRLWRANGQALDTSAYRLSNRTLYWRQPGAGADSLRVQYRVLPYDLGAAGFLVDTTQAQRAPDGILISRYDPYAGGDGLAAGRGLSYSGAFSRGLSFGNRQDLVLNSSFNLQMSGELGDGITVTAAITDDNLPIQPDGSTRQLREFDRVFIRLQRNETQLTAGDYELNRPEGYFMQYFKKLEGATFSTAQALGNGQWRSDASIAIARGQFIRRQLTPLEGNQGPYKLTGAGGERLVIVLAGTERVFLDGVLLERGRDRDYTIDYNQGEVVFMPRRLITKDSRITVEYEYADQRYLRSLYALNTSYTTTRGRAYVHLYSQQDSRTATGDLRLTPNQRELLRAAGDQNGSILLPTIDTLDGLAAQRATYQLVDTTLNCSGQDTTVRILLYNANPELGRFVANFTLVGEGQGNYELDPAQVANERVFRWVAPDPVTCQPRGSFEPVAPLPAPRLSRLLTGGLERQVGPRGQVRAELAWSQEDLNRFSALDADDDQGWALRLDWRHVLPLNRRDTTAGWQLRSEAGYERVQQNFRPVNPYRSPEFLRDWNLASVLGIGETTAADEQLGTLELALLRPGWGQVGYRTSVFQRGDIYQGQRQAANLRFERAGWRLLADAGILTADEPTRTSRFWRPVGELSKTWAKWGNWQTHFRFESERSERQLTASETLEPSSFFFRRYVAGLNSPAQAERQLSASWRRRQDFLPQGATFGAGPTATEAEVSGQWQAGQTWRLGGVFTYRNLAVPDSAAAGQVSGDTYLGRIDVGFNGWQGAVRANTTYELGSGQEPRIEFTYLYVGPGQGQYIWLDSLYNNDGKVQPNEMELSPFPDIADYVRLTLFTDNFIRTDNTTLNQSLQLDPERAWRTTAVPWKKQLNKFYFQSSLTVNRKTQDSPAVQAWNPLQWNLPDSALVAISASLRHTLYFNRRHPRYDLQLEQTDQRRRQVQTTGFESQRRLDYTLRARYNLTRELSLRTALALGDRRADSEFFNEKDFQLAFWRVAPEVVYQPGDDFRVGLKGQWQTEANRLPGATEKAQRTELAVEGAYQRWLRLNLSLVDIQLTGDPRSPVGFAILNGLQPGRNWLWNLAATQQLGRYLQLTISYEGRQTGQARTVHVGRAQVTAIF